jgi:hypothetical protein
MSDNVETIRALEREYDLDVGFLGRLRQGAYDPDGQERLLALLASIRAGDGPVINRRLVALLWMIPTIMSWQVERVREQGGDTVQLLRGIDRVQTRLNDILGTP